MYACDPPLFVAKSHLIVCGIEQKNDNCEGKLILYCKRKNGTFDPLTIYCSYATGWDIWYLRVCLLNLKKVYLYKLYYDIEVLDSDNFAEYAIVFDLNTAAIDSLDDSIDVCVFTCDCTRVDCSVFNLQLAKMTVIRPINEQKNKLLDEPENVETITDSFAKSLTISE